MAKWPSWLFCYLIASKEGVCAFRRDGHFYGGLLALMAACLPLRRPACLPLWPPGGPYGGQFAAYDGPFALMAACLPPWRPACLPLWPPVCPHAGPIALMAARLPLWRPVCPHAGRPVCPYDRVFARMAARLPLWQPVGPGHWPQDPKPWHSLASYRQWPRRGTRSANNF